MNDLQVFQNSEFGELGVLDISGKPYFPATACAKRLGYTKPHNAITPHGRYPLKQGVPHPQNPGKTLTMNFIPEGDLYRLIAHSNLPAAERFEKWVFDEVLPSIRRTGSYGQPDITAIIAQAITTACTETIKQLVPLLTTLAEQAAAPQRKTGKRPGSASPSVRRPTGIIENLDEAHRQRVEEMLRDAKCTYREIATWLNDDGIEISTMSISRYARRANCYPDYKEC